MTETPTETPTNPLAEASPSSLEDIFSTSPLERSDAEWRSVVETLRAQRAKWLVEEASGAKRASTKKPPLKAAQKTLTVDDLEI